MTDKKTTDLIRKQLSVRKRKLYCSHDADKPCDDCRKRISGNVSNISGNVGGIYGNVSGITATAEEIRKILMKEAKA